MSDAPRLPTYFISHGGGPWSFMPEGRERYAQLEAALQAMAGEVGRKPEAVLCISGHWEEPAFTVTASPRPPMLYDYYNFPDYTYGISYPAPGSPELAGRVAGLLEPAGFPVAADPERGFDHGTFTPFAVIYPQADVPIVQLSLRHDFDPTAHLAAGKALAPLRDEGTLIVGSGLSYHNLREFGGPRAQVASAAFDQWLGETLLEAEPAAREGRLAEWSAAPSARAAHPREEHLIPLMVAAGAASGEPATRVYHEAGFMDGLTVSSYRFG